MRYNVRNIQYNVLNFVQTVTDCVHIKEKSREIIQYVIFMFTHMKYLFNGNRWTDLSEIKKIEERKLTRKKGK